NILRALNQIKPADGAEVVELGAGTGRLTRLLAPAAGRIHAFDLSPHMLSIACATLSAMGLSNWTLAAGDNRRVPVKSGIADISIAGWSFGHMQSWYPATWRDEMRQILAEMQRVLKPGGTAII